MVIFLLIPFIIFMLVRKFLVRKEVKNIANKHIVVIGGSSGIGKSIAELAARKNAHVTIIARNIDKLAQAIEDIRKCSVNPAEQRISYVSVDVTNFEDIENNLCEIEETIGPIYMLVNCAGFAICGEMERFSVHEIKSLININILGSIYPVKAIIPKFKQRREGIIVLTGSLVSLFGMYGYSIYSSCKFALRGLAEAIHMELKPFGVTVTLALPPDTDTPGFHQENKSKPIETSKISTMGTLYKPDEVAEKILRDALDGNFFSYIGFNGFILTTLCKGFSPFKSFRQVIFESAILGLIRFVSAFYVVQMQKIIQLCFDEKEQRKRGQRKNKYT
ncbi:3-ketodihydrosphingosine reductase [Coccinella septempunctata]|uniref:3-ketodihydrosphingosine reductase n=1 Tax=Coccinella septempunctata TaxID=41139 RepID=UPI001D073E49|nr:3-ketodihydrosphingosine reductase [Coccinella septempunctata]XP_044765492.1 3-ketodihydrosphingosine reductase [Coccinella septempunctata]